jgi:hypothetical protein
MEGYCLRFYRLSERRLCVQSLYLLLSQSLRNSAVQRLQQPRLNICICDGARKRLASMRKLLVHQDCCPRVRSLGVLLVAV